MAAVGVDVVLVAVMRAPVLLGPAYEGEFHYTPKHASWLNMAEIEIGVLRRRCLDRRIDNRQRLEREIAAWQRLRNAAGARVKWMFTTQNARAKMGRAYPNPDANLDQPAKES